MRGQQFLVRACSLDRRTGGCQFLFRPGPAGPGGRDFADIGMGVPIEQGAMAARIDQTAIVMLP
jgi:hypothetical protein